MRLERVHSGSGFLVLAKGFHDRDMLGGHTHMQDLV